MSSWPASIAIPKAKKNKGNLYFFVLYSTSTEWPQLLFYITKGNLNIRIQKDITGEMWCEVGYRSIHLSKKPYYFKGLSIGRVNTSSRNPIRTDRTSNNGLWIFPFGSAMPSVFAISPEDLSYVSDTFVLNQVLRSVCINCTQFPCKFVSTWTPSDTISIVFQWPEPIKAILHMITLLVLNRILNDAYPSLDGLFVCVIWD